MKRMTMSARIARGLKLGLTQSQAKALGALRTPEAIQSFVSHIPMNFEPGGGTALSVTEVLKQNRAHCIEAAMVAACAFWMNGEPPLLMDMGSDWGDDDHVVALFRRRGHWGCVSKSNGPWLRYRDPIYRSLRELALSFMHEYSKKRRKTLRTYSVAVDLRRMDPRLWVTNPRFCEEVVDLLTVARHYRLMPRGVRLRLRDRVEMAADAVDEHPHPKSKQAEAERRARRRRRARRARKSRS